MTQHCCTNIKKMCILLLNFSAYSGLKFETCYLKLVNNEMHVHIFTK